MTIQNQRYFRLECKSFHPQVISPLTGQHSTGSQLTVSRVTVHALQSEFSPHHLLSNLAKRVVSVFGFWFGNNQLWDNGVGGYR